jgi:ABC-type uncharacterized transport system ATPase subunit
VRGRGIVKRFGDVIAPGGIDLDVAPRQIHGLVGPNGAGKTTLLGLLLGLAVADEGQRKKSTATSCCTSTGDARNPLWQFDGVVDVLAPTSKG